MNSLSIRFKLLLGSAVTVILSLGVIIFMALQSYKTSIDHVMDDTQALIEKQVKQQLYLTVDNIALAVEMRLNRGFDSARAVAGYLGNTAQGSLNISRDSASELVRSALSMNTQIDTLYAMFEPNAYDALDYMFNDSQGHSTQTGNIAIYWFWNEGNLETAAVPDNAVMYSETLTDTGIRESEWYLCPLESGQECLIEPYLFEVTPGNEVLMTSLTVPVVHNNKTIGVAGADLSLPAMQTLVRSLSAELYDGQSSISILSSQNRIIASSEYTDALGKSARSAAPSLLQPVDQTHAIRVEHRLKIANSSWRIMVEVPYSAALAELEQLGSKVDKNRQSTTWELIITSLIILAVTLVIVNLFIHGITKPIRVLAERMKALGGTDGDLTHELEASSNAELNDVADGFNSFTRKIRGLISELMQLSAGLQHSATSLAAAAQQTRASTHDQQQQLQSVATAANEMSATATEVANLAGRTAQDSAEADSEVTGTRQTLGQTVDEVGSMAEQLTETSQSIGSVAKRSDEIYSIIETIRGIADQTNLLALNAAIEAARAGDHGRGFSVVADEVRTLAGRTQEATGDIDNLISALKRDVDSSVEQMQACRDLAYRSVDDCRGSFERLEGTSQRITSISENTTQVATAAEEQSMVNEEINRNITQIGDAADALAQAASQVTSLGEEVSDSAARLDQQLGRFKV
ncbi:methyl-accepting chemotaxis protein [Marinobacterium stanieri]|uniref:methyl-accepting chemotaxis protein n=1 Tax=Marinobacterium stanieri TaxID=49186 RepID=UPI000255A87F|nr:methyl-accepting chemotaxis protein [Marinobacterium stanieri]